MRDFYKFIIICIKKRRDRNNIRNGTKLNIRKFIKIWENEREPYKI